MAASERMVVRVKKVRRKWPKTRRLMTERLMAKGNGIKVMMKLWMKGRRGKVMQG